MILAVAGYPRFGPVPMASLRSLVILVCIGTLAAQSDQEIRSKIAALADPMELDGAVDWLHHRSEAVHRVLIEELDVGGERRIRAVAAVIRLADSSRGRLDEYVDRLTRSNSSPPIEELRALEALLRHAAVDQRLSVHGQVLDFCSSVKPQHDLTANDALATANNAFVPRFRTEDVSALEVAVWRVAARLELGAETPMEQLVAALASGDPCTHLVAVEELASRLPLAPHVIELLFEALARGGFEQRGVDVLGRPRMSRWGWSRGDNHVMSLAVSRLLRKAAPADRRLLGALVFLFENGDAEERRQALFELGLSGPTARNHVRHVIRALRDPDPLIVREAIVALGLIGLPPDNEIRTRAQWRELLRDDDPEARRRAAEALSWSGPGENDARSLLRKLGDHADPQIAQRARATLTRLEEDRR